MSDRTCNKCGKVFGKPAQLVRHRGRKTPCGLIIDPADLPQAEDPAAREGRTCHFCGRVYSTPQGMQRHVREFCKIPPNDRNGDDGMEKLYEHTAKKQQEEISAVRAENADLRTQMNQMMGVVGRMQRQLVALGAPGGVSNTVNGDVNIGGDVHVSVNVFGGETSDHVTREAIRTILDECRKLTAGRAAELAILRTAMLVYSDPEHPENITAYLPNKKEDNVLIRSHQGWEVRPAQAILPPMAEKTLDALFEKQPHDDATAYGPLMKELRDNEKRYQAGEEVRPVLVLNKGLLRRAGALPARSQQPI